MLLLDEPTRGMDPGRRDALAQRLTERGGVTIVATHDPEFAAAFATRVILLGDGHPVADASPREVLAGGWYFATQVARVLGGAGGALTPEQGAQVLRAGGGMTWIAGSFLVLGAVIVVGFAWYERTHPSTRVLALVATLAAMAALGRVAFAALPNVKPTTDIVLISGYVLGGAPGFMVGAIAALASNLFFGQGPWTPWQMVAWGGVGLFGAGLAPGLRPRARAYSARRGLRDRRPRLRRGDEHQLLDHLQRRAVDRAADRLLRLLAAVRHRPRDRQRGLLPGVRAGAGPGLAALPHPLRHHLALRGAR